MKCVKHLITKQNDLCSTITNVRKIVITGEKQCQWEGLKTLIQLHPLIGCPPVCSVQYVHSHTVLPCGTIHHDADTMEVVYPNMVKYDCLQQSCLCGTVEKWLMLQVWFDRVLQCFEGFLEQWKLVIEIYATVWTELKLTSHSPLSKTKWRTLHKVLMFYSHLSLLQGVIAEILLQLCSHIADVVYHCISGLPSFNQ